MRKYLIPALAALALSGGAYAKAPTYATERVSIGDLDLASPEGVTTLEERISAAAEKVCHRAFVRDLRSTAKVNECKDIAIAGAMEQVAAIAKVDAAAFAGR
jgi:UrcA family protein